MTVLSVSTEVFACYSAACRPPTSGGTGGSGGEPLRVPARGLRRSAQSAERAKELADRLPTDTFDNAFQTVWLNPDASVTYTSTESRWGRLTPKDVEGIHPVDLYHVLAYGYADNGRQLHDADKIVRHLTGYRIVPDQKALDNGIPSGKPTPNGSANWSKAVWDPPKGRGEPIALHLIDKKQKDWQSEYDL